MSIGIDHGNKPLLIVDDSEADRALFRHLIERSHSRFCPEFIEADSIDKAVALLDEHEPYCCIVDYNLPGKNGFDFLRIIRSEPRFTSIPVVILTGEGDEVVAVEMLQNGAQDYLVKKDLTAERLIFSINNAVHTLALNNKINYLAHYDSLTGLLNRSLFLDRLQNAINHCERYRETCSLLFIDVDGFKAINDRYGHDAGDAVLKAIGDRMKKACRATDSAGRFGGDEFAVLLTNIDKTNTSLMAAKLLAVITKPITYEQRSIEISASIGIAYYPETASCPNELMQQADEAMYLVKQSGKNNFSYFTEEQKAQWDRRLILEERLPKALQNKELFLVYQPIVEAKTGRLHSLEVLVRWEPQGYTISTVDLIAMVDRLNLFDVLHIWLIDAALKQLHDWQSSEMEMQIALNIPVKHSHSQTVRNCLHQAMQTYGIKPSQIEFEVGEVTLKDHPNLSYDLLHRLHQEGVRIAIDDFGAGYSSMAHLAKLPIDTLKIDQKFFINLKEHKPYQKVISAITALGHSLDLSVVAEGIEDEDSCQVARSAGCDYLQGYYFGQPQKGGQSWAAFCEYFPSLLIK